MVNTEHTITAHELPNFVHGLPLVNDLKDMIREAPSIDWTKSIHPLIYQSNKDNH